MGKGAFLEGLVLVWAPTAQSCALFQGFMSGVCLLLQRGAPAALQRSHHPALLWHLCSSPFAGSRHLGLACHGAPAQTPRKHQPWTFPGVCVPPWALWQL